MSVPTSTESIIDKTAAVVDREASRLIAELTNKCKSETAIFTIDLSDVVTSADLYPLLRSVVDHFAEQFAKSGQVPIKAHITRELTKVTFHISTLCQN